jgi:hypothetical protein
MSAKKSSRSPVRLWEQALIDAYYDHRWHEVLDPLYDKFQRWKAGELDHADIDKAIHQTHKLTQELVEDMATGRFLAEQMAHLTTTTRTASD